jgi:hypothetical protein
MLREFLEGFGSLVELTRVFGPEVVHGVVAAPDDSIVLGETVVVELVVGVGQPLAASPTDGIELCFREGLGGHAIVVHGHDVVLHLAQQRRIGVGRQRHSGRPHRPERGLNDDTHAVLAKVDRLGVLIDPNTQFQGHPFEAPGQTHRVEHRRPVFAPQAADVGGRMHLGSHGILVE